MGSPNHSILGVDNPPLESVLRQFYPTRKLIGAVYLPDLSVITDSPLRHFEYPAEFTLNPFQTFQQIISFTDRFWLFEVMGNSVQGGSFRFFIKDGPSRQPFMKLDVNSANGLGSASHPFYIRRPQFFPAGRSINVQVSDTSNLANTIEIVLKGAIHDV